MADLRVYLDDERTPPDRGFTRHDGLVLIRTYSDFRKFLHALYKKGGEDKICFISFDYQLGYDKDWQGYFTGMDCLKMMIDMTRRFSRNDISLLTDDVIVDAHSSDAEASGRMLQKIREYEKSQEAGLA